MDKKGVELSINTMIIVILGLVVLVVLFYAIQRGITGGTNKYFNFSQEAENQLKAENTCAKMFSGRMCYQSACPASYVEISGDWEDCKKNSRICCEKM